MAEQVSSLLDTFSAEKIIHSYTYYILCTSKAKPLAVMWNTAIALCEIVLEWLCTSLRQEKPPGAELIIHRRIVDKGSWHLLPHLILGTHWWHSWVGCFPSWHKATRFPIIQLGRLEQCEWSFLFKETTTTTWLNWILNLEPFDYQADALATWLCCLTMCTHTCHVHTQYIHINT